MTLRVQGVLVAILAIAVASTACSYSISAEPPVTDKAATAEAATAESATVSLRVGDVAPRLTVDHWLRGEAIEAFSKDHVYVVEFWATWCSPCIKSMPHLSELAERYSKDGLVVVATTKLDEGNTREAVEEFIEGPGKGFRFRYALCEGDATSQAFMEAAGQKGIPCSFVIDRQGKVAYIGHPRDLDYVLERVFSGKWRGQADVDELLEMNSSVIKLGELSQSDPAKALEIVDHIRLANPARAKALDFAYAETMVLCKNQLFDRAKATIQAMCDPSNESIEWGSVAMLCGLLASTEMNPEGLHQEFADAQMQAAETALKDDWQNLIQVGVAYKFLGRMDKFEACMNRVIDLCPDEQVKKTFKAALEMQLQQSGR